MKFREYILKRGFASEEELLKIEKNAKELAKKIRSDAWNAYRNSLKPDFDSALKLLKEAAKGSQAIEKIKKELEKTPDPFRRDVVAAVKQTLRLMRANNSETKTGLLNWIKRTDADNERRYNSYLYSEHPSSPMNVKPILPEYTANSAMVDGREIINTYFDALFARDCRVIAIVEDVGKIGDVNQGFAGLQEKHGEIRISDTGIRETTIVGQGIGAAMRGLRPIVEIQYFDYIYYALSLLTDDVACLHYRSVGGLSVPLIVRTRGHRLEGIWHSGSPMAVMINALRGMHIIVPRNFVQAAGFYNTIMKGDDPALIIECLNGYRLKEKMPQNLAEICVPLGVPEILKTGSDITLITYGSMCRIVMEAATQLEEIGISLEVIDVQTLLPFDVHHSIVESIKKTNRVIFADEDMPGGATAYMMKAVLEDQNAYRWLDAAPQTITAKAHRPAYAPDGDYFSKPNAEIVFDVAYEMMHETNPKSFLKIY